MSSPNDNEEPPKPKKEESKTPQSPQSSPRRAGIPDELLNMVGGESLLLFSGILYLELPLDLQILKKISVVKKKYINVMKLSNKHFNYLKPDVL